MLHFPGNHQSERINPEKPMKPKPPVRQTQRELFRVKLDQLVDLAHALVKLGQADQLGWL
jgi:hypothetical protein